MNPIRFDDFEFDRRECRLTRGGRPIPLQRQPALVLAILLEGAGQVVTREQIRAALWADRHVEVDLGLNYCIRQVRAALCDDAMAPRYVATLRGRGYRFVAPIDPVGDRVGVATGVNSHRATRRRHWVGAVAAAALLLSQQGTGSRPVGSATLAFLPFENLTDNAACAAAARRIARAVGAALSVADPPALRVVEASAGRAGPPTYFVTGAISVRGGRHRVSMRLIRSADGLVVWSYSVDTGTAMERPPEIAGQVIQAMVVNRSHGES